MHYKLPSGDHLIRFTQPRTDRRDTGANRDRSRAIRSSRRAMAATSFMSGLHVVTEGSAAEYTSVRCPAIRSRHFSLLSPGRSCEWRGVIGPLRCSFALGSHRSCGKQSTPARSYTRTVRTSTVRCEVGAAIGYVLTHSKHASPAGPFRNPEVIPQSVSLAPCSAVGAARCEEALTTMRRGM